eukprot:3872433-Pyramimonas_sp.AAC.1
MPLRPRLDLKGAPLVPRPPKPKVDPQPHRWVRVPDVWQRFECLKVARGVHDLAPLAKARSEA